MDDKCRITETTIGGTVYVVEARESETATEDAYTKVRRLIIANAKSRLKTRNNSANNIKIDSTSSK